MSTGSGYFTLLSHKITTALHEVTLIEAPTFYHSWKLFSGNNASKPQLSINETSDHKKTVKRPVLKRHFVFVTRFV